MNGAASSLKTIFVLIVVGIGVTLYLMRDSALPAVSDTVPPPGAEIAAGAATIGATVRGDAALSAAELIVDGQPLPTTLARESDRHWGVSAEHRIGEGPHEAVVTVRDMKGRTRSYRWSFVAAAPEIGPVFAAAEPADGSVVAAGEFQAAIVVESRLPITAATLSLNETNVPLQVIDPRPEPGVAVRGQLLFHRQPLDPGDYRLRVAVVDEDGATAEHVWTVRVVPPDDPAVDTRFFPGPGVYVSDPFLSFWTERGGEPIFGEPISHAYPDRSGATVQYFARARLETWDGTVVQLGNLGLETRDPDPPVRPRADSALREYFDNTGHTTRDPFKTFWSAHGGLEVFGAAITEERPEGSLRVQYFEKARLEYHPELEGQGETIVVTPLGQERWNALVQSMVATTEESGSAPPPGAESP